jgi:hypothetical protein
MFGKHILNTCALLSVEQSRTDPVGLKTIALFLGE